MEAHKAKQASAQQAFVNANLAASAPPNRTASAEEKEDNRIKRSVEAVSPYATRDTHFDCRLELTLDLNFWRDALQALAGSLPILPAVAEAAAATEEEEGEVIVRTPVTAPPEEESGEKEDGSGNAEELTEVSESDACMRSELHACVAVGLTLICVCCLVQRPSGVGVTTSSPTTSNVSSGRAAQAIMSMRTQESQINTSAQMDTGDGKAERSDSSIKSGLEVAGGGGTAATHGAGARQVEGGRSTGALQTIVRSSAHTHIGLHSSLVSTLTSAFLCLPFASSASSHILWPPWLPCRPSWRSKSARPSVHRWSTTRCCTRPCSTAR